jgi:serine/threonine protein kinase
MEFKTGTKRAGKECPASIGEFQVMKMIGEGSFGSVYLGKHQSNDAYVAIKSAKKKDESEKTAQTQRRLMEQELNILRQLDHGNIVRCYKSLEASDGLHIVMEYVSGMNLDALLASGKARFSEADASEVVRYVLEGVAHMHERNVVHRDLKPGKLLLTQATS